MISSGEEGSSSKTTINIHVDLDTLNRGWTEGDGFCEVAGLGPIPVQRVRSEFDEAALRVLLTSKNKLLWSGNKSKTLPARVKDAINAFNRHHCSRCGQTSAEVDHVIARTNGGNHDISNLQSLCWTCHKEKTLVDAPWSARYYGQARGPDKKAG